MIAVALILVLTVALGFLLGHRQELEIKVLELEDEIIDLQRQLSEQEGTYK